MPQIHGVNAALYHRLPAEDQQAIRQHHATRQQAPERAPARQQQPPPGERATAANARTPAQAVRAIHSLPVPSYGNVPQALPGPDRVALYLAQVASFNERRADEALAALERLQPDASQFQAHDGRTQAFEYEQALALHASDPYAAHLERIVAEATQQPDHVPEYLHNADRPIVDTTRLDIFQARTALEAIGVDLPVDATPAQVQNGYDVLAALPDGVLAWAINPGHQVEFETTLIDKGTTPHVALRASADVSLAGAAEMSRVHTGLDFRQTQSVALQVQLQGNTEVSIGRTPLNNLYRNYNRAVGLGVPLPDGKSLLGSPLHHVLKGSPVSGKIAASIGTRVAYEAVVTPEQGARITDGDISAAPNPFEPMSMPVGTGVLMRGQTFTGSQFEASFKRLNASSTYTDLSGQGFGVRRLDANTFEIVAGEIDAVESNLLVGVGNGDATIGLRADRSIEGRSMAVARLDLRTEEGRAAYQAFMGAGHMPAWSPPGVLQAGSVDVLGAEHVTRFGFRIGEFGWGADINRLDSEFTATRWADGTAEYTLTRQSGDNHFSQVSWSADKEGNREPGSSAYGLMLANYHPTLAGFIDQAYNHAPGSTHSPENSFVDDRNVRLEFTEGELMQLRQDARDYILGLNGERDGHDALNALDTDPSNHATTLVQKLAASQTPDAVFEILSDRHWQGALSEQLLAMSSHLGRHPPGTLTVRDAD